jgi:hypothetical protein
MPQMPPVNQDLREAENIDRIAEALRSASILGSDFVSNMSIALQGRLVKGLRAEGLDGGNWRSRFLHGGDAQRTAKMICQPLRAAADDLYNAAVNFLIFKRRMKTMYIEAIRSARQAQTGDDTVVVK